MKHAIQLPAGAETYIEKYRGKTIVVKYGGNAMTTGTLKDAVMEDVLFLTGLGMRIVLVHGGGPEINRMLSLLGRESRFVGGLRYTDADTMEVVQMVLAGKVNKDLVCRLAAMGGRALGLCGADAGMLLCERHTAADLGLVGDIVKTDPGVITTALDAGMIPVSATIGADLHGRSYNINADTAAAAVAVALGASRLISLTDIRGLLMDPHDESTLIPDVGLSQIPALIDSGVISGGMIPKIECCADCIGKGVGGAVITDGRVPHAILLELLSEHGNGTLIYNDKETRKV